MHTNKETKNKMVPKLRFPEFRDGDEWEEMPLNEICEVNPSVEKLPEEFVYIDLESVEDGKLLQKKIIQLGQAPSRAQRLLKAGDIIFQMVRPYQKNNYFFQPNDDLNYVASTGYAQLRAYQSVTYLYHYLHHQNFVDKVLAKSTGSNYPAINPSALSEILVVIPKPDEQQKIASCLSSLDDLITAENQKLEALKAHKKGLMQQLFPAEGKKVPELRFEEFKESGEWEEKRLDELLQFKNGINASKELYGKGIKFINVLDILNNEFITYEKIIGLVDVSDETADNFSVNYGDILFQRSSETQEEVGTANVYLDKDRTSTFGGFVIRGRKIAEYEPLFLNKLLKTQAIRNSISSKSGGSTRFNIGQEALSSVKILIPSISEQQKIAFCLSSLDDLLTAQAEKIEALKEHKKGLMQGLFPSASVT